MQFDVLAVRRLDEQDHDYLYPVTFQDGVIALDPRDGSRVMPFMAKEFTVQEMSPKGWRTVHSKGDIRLACFCSDSRLGMSCLKYDRGGGWVSLDLGVMMALNVASKAIAKARSSGKVLVGHVRFEWLRSVGWAPKRGLLTNEELVLQLVDGTGTNRTRDVRIVLALAGGSLAGCVAHDVAQRAARYRLASSESMEAGVRQRMEALAGVDPNGPQPGSYATYAFPSWFPVRGTAPSAYTRGGSTRPTVTRPEPLIA